MTDPNRQMTAEDSAFDPSDPDHNLLDRELMWARTNGPDPAHPRRVVEVPLQEYARMAAAYDTLLAQRKGPLPVPEFQPDFSLIGWVDKQQTPPEGTSISEEGSPKP